MAFTAADVIVLKRAIATGALRVKYQDREVTYRSLKEMRETLALIEAEVLDLAGGRRIKSYQMVPTRGIE